MLEQTLSSLNMRCAVSKTLLLIGLTLLSACASQEARIKKKTFFGGEKIDISSLNYFELTTGQDVNLKTYMEANKLDYVFLIFGSVGCVKCNQKALDLSENFLGKHSLFLNAADLRFELIGVNTDIGNAKKRFDQIWANTTTRKGVGYDFINWSDPGAVTVKEQLLASGSSFAVPFMVLLKKDTLVARYNANDTRSIGTILSEVLALIRGETPNEGTGEENPKPPSSRPRPMNVAIDPVLIAQQGRFEYVSGRDCALGKKIKLSQTMATQGIKYLHLPAENCDQSCAENLRVLGDVRAKLCQNGEHCAVVDYRVDQDSCQREWSFLAENRLRDGFQTAFNWQQDLVEYSEYGEPTHLASDKRSYVLAFDASDRLIFAKAGVVTYQELANLRAVPAKAHMPKFKFYGQATKDASASQMTLQEILPRKHYTVIYEYGAGCESCDAKLQKWSAPQGLLEFCQKSGDLCQMFALNLPLAGLQTPVEAYKATTEHMKQLPKPASLPLLVENDTIQNGPQGDPYSRFFEGFLKPQFLSSWADSYGFVLNGATVIYDWEGKVIAEFAPSTDPDEEDPVAKVIKSLAQFHGRSNK